MYSAFQLAQKYLNYYSTAYNSKGHGVHSPFVFHFIKYIKNNNKKAECYKPIEDIRKLLLQNNSFIEVQDFGAGSSVIKTNSRQVKKIAASSLKHKKFAQLLYRIVEYYQPKTMVELGTSFGITSAYLASAHRTATLYTLEGSPAIAAIAKNNFQLLGLKNIQLLEGDFKNTFSTLLQGLPAVDFAFVDGNHKNLLL